MEKKKLTTTLPPAIIQRIKVQAVKEQKTLSELLEELITKYLESNEIT